MGAKRFLCELYDSDPEAVLAAADAARLNLSRAAPDNITFLEAVARQNLPEFAQRLRHGWIGQ